jgi:tetratricopeptide (TPR) repeat protein
MMTASLMSTTVYDVVDAYRADLANATRSEAFGERDDAWLVCGTILQRALALPSDTRRPYLDAALADLLPETFASRPSNLMDADALAFLVETHSEEAEDAGAYALAMVLLDLGRALIPLDATRLQGRLLTRQARVRRKLGALDEADATYDQVEQAGLEAGDEELVCRGRLGKGIVARMRGNYPAARGHFSRVLESTSGETAIHKLRLQAHQGMMIAAGVAGDFDTALRHGWTAYDGWADEPPEQSSTLVNLAQVCYESGQYRAALNGFLLVLAKPLVSRVRLTALGNAALAAAHLGEKSILDQLANQGIAMIDPRNDQFEVADLEVSLAQAFFLSGDSIRGDVFKQRALERARAGSFFEILHEAESLGRVTETPRAPAFRFSDVGRAVTRNLASRDSDQLLTVAFSRSD